MLSMRFILLCPVVVLVTACATPAAQAPATPPPVTDPVPVDAPVAAPVLPPLTPSQAQKMTIGAVELLEAGNEEQAKTDLQRVLASDPGNKLAQNLLRQITATDPVAMLGRESFPYTVRSSDTLSRIAGRFLGDIYAFYILARYNDIKIPRQVAGGQVIRIPGKAPPPGVLENEARKDKAAASATPVAPAAPVAPTAPVVAEPSAGDRALLSAESAERRGDLERAYTDYRLATGGELGNESLARAEQLRRRLVTRYTLAARSAFAKQDLDGSIRQWDRVLQLEPGNDTARLEQQKARSLKVKINSLK